MVYVFDDFELDTQLFELRHSGHARPVEPQVFDVLRYLVDNRDRVVSKEELFREVWGDRIVTESALSSRLKAARQAIGDNGREQRLIKTVHGRGYRFVGTVESKGAQPIADRASAPGSEQTALSIRPSGVHAVGRDAELTRIAAALEEAQTGARQVIFITGEAGLGKTTLVEAFLSRLEDGAPVRVLLGHCLEQHGRGEAYLPLLEALGAAGRQSGTETILNLLRRRAPSWLLELPWLIDAEEMETLRSHSRGLTRERMMREMVEALEELAAEETLILVLEDLHWSDPSTVDFLAWLANRREPARILILGTYRAGDARTGEHPIDTVAERLKIRHQAREIRLEFLDESSTREYLARRLPGVDIPADFGGRLKDRTEGNPLFMGSVIDHWIEQGAVQSEEGHWRVVGCLDDLCQGVPESLRLLIERRLAGLDPDDLELLEAASVAGSEFPATALAAVVDASADRIETCCADLARDGLLLESCGSLTWPDGTVSACFRFVHSLYQEVLYDRIPRGRRARLHAAIGSHLERTWAGKARERAAELAGHFRKGGDAERATGYYLQAAQQALRRLAQAEACDHLRAGLELLPSLPADRSRDELELSFQSALAPTLIAMEGFSSTDAEIAFGRARELCEILGDTRQLSAVIYGLAIQFELRGEFRRSQTLMEERLELADAPVDRSLVEVETYDLLACSHFHQARYPQALRLAEAGIEAFGTHLHSSTASNYGENPSIGCHGWAGLSLWFMGFPDQALEVARRAVELSKQPGQAYSLSNSKMQVAGVYQLRRETTQTRTWSEETIRNARADGFVMRVAMGQLYTGWAEVVEHRTEDSVQTLEEGLKTLEHLGVRLDRPYFLGLYAEALAVLGRVDEALEQISSALEMIEQPQSHFFEAELHRLQGEMLLRTGNGNAEAAEESLLRSLDQARRQEARSIELRAAMSLTRLWRDDGRQKEAVELLGPLQTGFTEGLETPDLVEAKRLLASIS